MYMIQTAEYIAVYMMRVHKLPVYMHVQKVTHKVTQNRPQCCSLTGQSGNWAAAVDLTRFGNKKKLDLSHFGNKVIFISLNFHVSNLKSIKLEVLDCELGDNIYISAQRKIMKSGFIWVILELSSSII